ncbi:MAG: formylglycine-generating enzyme family protein [Gammaproteobacteria bacterium]|nr:formylglycine-generating enzyme family protein [Gammaproteobacteria bacterium]
MLFPAFIERVAFPYGFGRIQTADLVSWTGEPEHPGLAQLLESLRLHLNGAGLASSSLAKEVDGRFELTKPGQTFRDSLKIGGEGPLMVVIPAGRFLMGSPPDEPERFDDEGPQHEVRIAKPFALGVHAVTFDDYDRYCDATRQAKPEDRGWGRGNRPVINVSWTDAQAYCDWLNGQTERGYRLPSEAEWEYACRAGTTTPFSFGANITPEQVNYNGSSPYAGGKKGLYREKTVPVGSLPPNPWGLHEMHGNVWEWCQDHWHDNYQSAPTDGSAWLGGAPGERRVLRGGSWIIHGRNARSAYRYHFEPGLRNRIFGFRLAQVQS